MLIATGLIIVFVLFFAISFWRVLKAGDHLFSIFYAYLFVYTVFTQMGYVFYPDPAIKLRVYFGLELFYSYWLFVFLTFVATVGLFLFRTNFFKKRPEQSLAVDELRLSRLPFLLVIATYLITLVNLFYWNLEGIRYANIDNAWIGYLVNLQPVVILIIYIDLRRSKTTRHQKLVVALMGMVAVGMFLIISIRAGQRLAGLALLTGIAAFEFGSLKNLFARRRNSLRKLLSVRVVVLGVVVIFFLALAVRIVALREHYGGVVPIEALLDLWPDKGGESTFNLETIMYQDYFAPSSLLFVSMATDWVDPGEVFRSNIYNAVPFTRYPYLQTTLSEAANPIVYTRTESYGYYLLNEGYNFGGWFGIIYNAIMVNLGLGLWRLFSNSRDPRVKERMTAVLCLLVVGAVRGPSVMFLRSVYLIILPSLGLIWLSLGYYPGRKKIFSGKKFPSVELPRHPSPNIRLPLSPN